MLIEKKRLAVNEIVIFDYYCCDVNKMLDR